MTSFVTQSLFGFCAFSVVLFLWLRQRVLYATILPKAHFTKTLKLFSFMIIFIGFMFGVNGIILSSIPNNIVSSPIGCVYKKDGNLLELLSIFAGTALIFCQVSLLAVFIHAMLVLHGCSVGERWKIILLCNRKSSNEQPADQTRIMIYNAIRKTIIFAAFFVFKLANSVFRTFIFA